MEGIVTQRARAAGYQALTAGGTMRNLLAAVMSSASTFERSRN